MIDDRTSLGLKLPHPDNPPRTVDVPRLREALTLVDQLLGGLRDDIAEVPDLIQAAVSLAVAALVGGSPAAMDTLAEIAARIEAGEDAATALASVLATKASSADLMALATRVGAAEVSVGTKADAAATSSRLGALEDYRSPFTFAYAF